MYTHRPHINTRDNNSLRHVGNVAITRSERLIQKVQWPVVKCLAGRDATLEVAQLCSDGRQFMFLTGTMRTDCLSPSPPPRVRVWEYHPWKICKILCVVPICMTLGWQE